MTGYSLTYAPFARVCRCVHNAGCCRILCVDNLIQGLICCSNVIQTREIVLCVLSAARFANLFFLEELFSWRFQLGEMFNVWERNTRRRLNHAMGEHRIELRVCLGCMQCTAGVLASRWHNLYKTLVGTKNSDPWKWVPIVVQRLEEQQSAWA